VKDDSDVEVEVAVVHMEAWSQTQQHITFAVVISTLGCTMHTASMGLLSSLLGVFAHGCLLIR
jgi:hypothetical protein